jgi:CMP-N-acetylneuraminic acid synthetase
MNVISVITARAGSKGILRKNIRLLGGKPLMVHSIEASLAASRVSRTLFSTDDEEFAEIARQHGAEVPFMRPPELAADHASHMSVMLHLLDWLEAHGELPDALLLLQPTCPLRTAQDLDGAIALMETTGCPAVVGMCETVTHPFLTYALDAQGQLTPFIEHGVNYPRRQDLPPAYQLNGALYLNRSESLRGTNAFQPPGTRPWIMPVERSVDIDSLDDFALAELILARSKP